MQIQELAPKIEAMEASWNRLRTITGADEPEEVIAYWEGLKSKEENMRQLVAASEAQEAAVKVCYHLTIWRPTRCLLGHTNSWLLCLTDMHSHQQCAALLGACPCTYLFIIDVSFLQPVQTKIEELLKRRNDLLEQDASAAASSSAVDNSEDYEVCNGLAGPSLTSTY